MDLYQALLARANADQKEMGVEPNPSKRAWLGGRAQVLLSVANFIKDEAPSDEELEAEVDRRLSKVAEAVKRIERRDDAQYDVGKIAGLNLVRRFLRANSPKGGPFG